MKQSANQPESLQLVLIHKECSDELCVPPTQSAVSTTIVLRQLDSCKKKLRMTRFWSDPCVVSPKLNRGVTVSLARESRLH